MMALRQSSPLEQCLEGRMAAVNGLNRVLHVSQTAGATARWWRSWEGALRLRAAWASCCLALDRCWPQRLPWIRYVSAGHVFALVPVNWDAPMLRSRCIRFAARRAIPHACTYSTLRGLLPDHDGRNPLDALICKAWPP